MATTNKCRMDPELEEIRKDVPTPPDTNELIKDLITTPKIHAAFLYSRDGITLLQTLCIWLSGTKSTYHYSGWENFGIKLGLDPIVINNIKYSLHNEDPASYVFLAYVEKDDATIEHILYTLQAINRNDILLQIEEMVRNLNDAVFMKCNTNEETNIITPNNVPNCPFIFKNLNKKKGMELKIAKEAVQKSTPIVHNPQPIQRRYAKTILLTYSSDAQEIVQECLAHLRKPRNNMKLGIVVLNEHREKLITCPEQFIFECFVQVDYVFPIITTQYLEQVMNSAMNFYSALDNADNKYVKYVYTLMNTHYSTNGCKNTKVRCLIPDDIVRTVLKHPVMQHSLFQVWERVKEINTLIDSVLKLKV